MRLVAIAMVVLIACARSAPAPEPAQIAWSTPIELANGGGTKGAWLENDSQFDYVDDPSVALLPDGAAAVVWTDQRDKDIRFQVVEHDGTKRHSHPTNVSRTPAVFSWLPRVAVDGDDVFVLWQEIASSGGGGEVYFARSHDGGATFDPPIDLSRSKNGDGKGRLDASTWDNGSLDLVLADDGTLYAAWTEFDGPLWISRSNDRGATFSQPLLIAGTPAQPARAPTIAARGDTVYVAWTIGEDRAANIRLARSDDAGATFNVPIIVTRTAGYSDAPRLAIDATGTLHLVFSEAVRGGHKRSAVFYSRSTDGRVFSPPRQLSETGAAFPALALDEDTLWVTWEVYGTAELPRGLGLAYSLDGGATFSEPQFVAGSADPEGGWNGSQQGKLTRKLAVRDGAIAIVNSSLEHGDHSRVWLIRGRRTAEHQ